MNSRLLERILVAILLLLDLFLLGVVLSDTAENRRSREETVTMLTDRLDEAGIAASADALMLDAAPSRLSLTRNMQEENRKMERLLDVTYHEDMGGNIIFYRGGKGQAVLRGSGDMDILFQSEAVPLRGGTEQTARGVLRKLGISAEPAEPSAAEREESQRLTMTCCISGYPVYNAVLQFDFSSQRLEMVSGTRLFDTVREETGVSAMDGASVLMRFLEIVRTEGYICSEVTGMRPGYLLSVTMSGECVLTPVWQIGTDTGGLLIDAETGKIANHFT